MVSDDETDQYEPERTDWERETLGTDCSLDENRALQISDRHVPTAWMVSTVAVFDLEDMA